MSGERYYLMTTFSVYDLAGNNVFVCHGRISPNSEKVLVPLRKFAFQKYIYQRFTNETGEPNLQ